MQTHVHQRRLGTAGARPGLVVLPAGPRCARQSCLISPRPTISPEKHAQAACPGDTQLPCWVDPKSSPSCCKNPSQSSDHVPPQELSLCPRPSAAPAPSCAPLFGAVPLSVAGLCFPFLVGCCNFPLVPMEGVFRYP